MSDPRHPTAARLRGLARLGLDATLGLTDLVEAMHSDIARPWPLRRADAPARTRGVTGGVYRAIRGTSRLAARGLDAGLAALAPVLPERTPSARDESFVAALNGVLGDHLEASGNPLAILPQLRYAGRELPAERDAIAATITPESRLVVLVHGLCRSDLHWRRNGHDHGAQLASDLGRTPIYFRYNSGLHVSANGRTLAALLEATIAKWPVEVEELSIVAHSLGGLVARSACHYAEVGGATWPRLLRHLVFLGTPHHGAPLERGGQWLHRVLGAVPYARPLARLGAIRSAGITDLRHGNLLDEDWQGRDRFAGGPDRRRPVRLPPAVSCAAIAAVSGGGGGAGERWAWDGWVSVDSALGRHSDPALSLRFPADRRWVGRGMGHLDLLDRPEVYQRLRSWLSA